MGLRIAARKSDLARLQAYQVGAAIQQHKPQDIDYYFRESLGDINQDDPLWKMPEKGVFTEDFREGLIKGDFDIVVHSWKDLPVELDPDTEIVATLPRADMRDLLLFKKAHLEKLKASKKLRVYSSSPRRIYNLSSFFKYSLPAKVDDVEFESVRGNILTRVRKMIEDPQIDGLIVAKAAIDRLLSVSQDEFQQGKMQLQSYLDDCLWQVLPLSKNPTAAAQGALAVEIRKDRDDLRKIFETLNSQPDWQAVQSERKILKSYGGGCHQKIGISEISRDYGKIEFLCGETDHGEILNSCSLDQNNFKLQNPCPEFPTLFERKQLPYQKPLDANCHFIARSTALPEGEVIAEEQVIWTSGINSWKKLAARGYWVNGSSESLGEQEDPAISSLIPSAVWLKWTHDQSPALSEKLSLATYQLVPIENVEIPTEYDEYFWMSGSQFKRAISLEPKLLQAKHFCGPGFSHQIIASELQKHGVKQMPTRILNYQVWKSKLKELKND